MGFRIVGASNQWETVWAPITKGDTVYVGQIVRCNNEGVEPLAVASGVGDEANHMVAVGSIADGASANNVPFGIVIGTNARTPAFDTTQKAEKMVELVTTSATSDTYFGVEGPLGVPKDSMVEVALIYPHTRIRGPLCQAALGTALTVGTISTGGTVSATSSAVGCTSVASLATVYFRTGACAGQYRILDSASTTALTWDAATDGTVAVGDTCVVANCRSLGLSRAYIDSEAMYIDGSAALTSNYLFINVLKLDLSVAGQEYVEFNFNAQQFVAVDDIA